MRSGTALTYAGDPLPPPGSATERVKEMID